jgi:Sigma-70 region 2
MPAQSSLQRAFTNLGRFRKDSTFSTWVTRVATNEALMLLRQRRAKTPVRENYNDDTAAPSVLDHVGTRTSASYPAKVQCKTQGKRYPTPVGSDCGAEMPLVMQVFFSRHYSPRCV